MVWCVKERAIISGGKLDYESEVLQTVVILITHAEQRQREW